MTCRGNTVTLLGSFESPWNLTRMKVWTVRWSFTSHAGTGRTCRLKAWTFLLWGDSANHCPELWTQKLQVHMALSLLQYQSDLSQAVGYITFYWLSWARPQIFCSSCLLLAVSCPIFLKLMCLFHLLFLSEPFVLSAFLLLSWHFYWLSIRAIMVFLPLYCKHTLTHTLDSSLWAWKQTVWSCDEVVSADSCAGGLLLPTAIHLSWHHLSPLGAGRQ